MCSTSHSISDSEMYEFVLQQLDYDLSAERMAMCYQLVAALNSCNRTASELRTIFEPCIDPVFSFLPPGHTRKCTTAEEFLFYIAQFYQTHPEAKMELLGFESREDKLEIRGRLTTKTQLIESTVTLCFHPNSLLLQAIIP